METVSKQNNRVTLKEVAILCGLTLLMVIATYYLTIWSR